MWLQEEEAKGERMQAKSAQIAYEGARKRESERNILARQQSTRARKAEELTNLLQENFDKKMWDGPTILCANNFCKNALHCQ